jgi:hypothetical protein
MKGDMGKMDEARRQLRLWIEQAQPGSHVVSVASLSEAVGGLSTAATVVVREAIEQGWMISTRGPAGGYWRTDKAMVKSLDEALAALADQFGRHTAKHSGRPGRDCPALTGIDTGGPSPIETPLQSLSPSRRQHARRAPAGPAHRLHRWHPEQTYAR